MRDARDEIADLRRLLARARVEPPYVLVGHSYGGVLARVFAHLYPSETAGLVLIDTMGRDGRRRQLAIWPRSQAPEIRRELATTVMEGVDLAAGEAIASRVTSLGGMPLAVITAGRQDNFPRTPARLDRALKRLWDGMQDELAALSDNSVHVVALASNHDVPSSHNGQPSVIVRAVQAVVGAARSHARLPSLPASVQRLRRSLHVAGPDGRDPPSLARRAAAGYARRAHQGALRIVRPSNRSVGSGRTRGGACAFA